MANADIRISQLETELEAKKLELEGKEKEVNEAAEIKYRMDSITSMLSTHQKRAQTLKVENDELKERISTLEEQIRQAAAHSRPGSISAHPSTETPKAYNVFI